MDLQSAVALGVIVYFWSNYKAGSHIDTAEAKELEGALDVRRWRHDGQQPLAMNDALGNRATWQPVEELLPMVS